MDSPRKDSAFERAKALIIDFGCASKGCMFTEQQVKELRDMVEQVITPMEKYHIEMKKETLNNGDS